MINKFKLIARLGLMHLVGTNVCVWIRTLGKETLHVSYHCQSGLCWCTLYSVARNLQSSFAGTEIECILLGGVR